MTWNAKVSITGDTTAYSYPDGPFIPNLFFDQVEPGVYLVRRGDAMLRCDVPAEMAQITDLGPHHVTLEEAGATLFDNDLKAHPWNCEYTIRAADPVLKRQPKDVFDLNLMPVYGNTGNSVSNVGFNPVDRIFQTGSVTRYMPTTGERPDIGITTDWAAAWLLGASPDAMLAVAFASNGFAEHWRDARGTGLQVDLIKYPGINAADAPGLQGNGPYIVKGPQSPTSGYFTYSNGTCPQPAHYCDRSYVATIAYKDKVFLKQTVDGAIFCVGQSDEINLPDGRRVMAGEYRGIGHGWGMLVKARAAILDGIANGYFDPRFHPPVSMIDALLDSTLLSWSNSIKSPISQAFFILPNQWVGPWQHSYVTNNMLLAVLTGRKDHADFALFCLKNTVARFSTDKDWPIAWGAYYIGTTDYDGNVLPGWSGAQFDHFYQSEQDNAATALAHGQSYAPGITTALYKQLKADPTNGFQMTGTTEQTFTDMAIMNFANCLDSKGLLAVRATIPGFDAAYSNLSKLFKSLGGTNPRVSIVSKYDPANLANIETYVAGDQPPPGQPGQPAPPPPNYGTDQPGPDSDPKSFAFENPSDRDAVTTLDNIFFDVSGKVPSGFHQVVANIKGNGKTKVWLVWDSVNPGFEVKGPDTPAGADVFFEMHGSGDEIRLYGCAALVLNGSLVWQSQAEQPAPSQEPDPIPAPVPDPTPVTPPPTEIPPVTDSSNSLSALATAVHAITTVKDGALAALQHLEDRLSAMAAAATGAGTQVDPAQLKALVDELSADKDALASAIANVPQ
jgi:hypothetical protein